MNYNFDLKLALIVLGMPEDYGFFPFHNSMVNSLLLNKLRDKNIASLSKIEKRKILKMEV